MAEDPIADRFSKCQERHKLEELAKRARGKDDVEAEEKLLKTSEKIEPLKAGAATGRNDPCPCGSGKKYKKCCGSE